MTRSQVSFPCNSTGFAGFKVIPIQFRCNVTNNCLNCAKLRLNILEEEYGEDVEPLAGWGVKKYLFLWWSGEEGDLKSGWGQGMGKHISPDWISLLHRVGSSWVMETLSTLHYKRLREAKKEVSFSKVSKVCGPERERSLRGFGRVSLPLLR